MCFNVRLRPRVRVRVRVANVCQRARACVCTVYAEIKKGADSRPFRGIVSMCGQYSRHDTYSDEDRHDRQMASPLGSVIRRHSRAHTRTVGNNDVGVASSFPSLNPGLDNVNHLITFG